jgi:hypothetical protein
MQPEPAWRHDESIEGQEETQAVQEDLGTPMTGTMFRAGIAGALIGAIVGGLIGFAAAAAMYGIVASASFVMVIIALAFAGGVAGGVIAGWRGGLADKAVDERRPSYYDRDLRRPHGTMPKGWR